MDNLTLFTLAETADILKVSLRQLHRMRAAGQIPPPIKVGRSPRYTSEQLQLYIAKQTISAR